jgi:hypothetical protein
LQTSDALGVADAQLARPVRPASAAVLRHP